jgi:hypoxanthine phosphoribosyltransferase
MKTRRVTWEEIDARASELAQLIKNSGKEYRQIVGVARGGLIPAVLLSHRLGIDHVSSVCSSSSLILRIDRTLIVDDLVDSGATSERLSRYLFWTDVAVLYAKPDGELMADYFAERVPQDTWLVFPWELR